MRRYKMVLLIRHDSVEAEHEGMEKEVKHNCTATSAVAARRDAIEKAFSNGCLVSRFLEVREGGSV